MVPYMTIYATPALFWFGSGVSSLVLIPFSGESWAFFTILALLFGTLAAADYLLLIFSYSLYKKVEGEAEKSRNANANVEMSPVKQGYTPQMVQVGYNQQIC